MSNETTLDDVLALPGKWREMASRHRKCGPNGAMCGEIRENDADELDALLPALQSAMKDARRLRTMMELGGCPFAETDAAWDSLESLRAAIDAAQEVGRD